MAVRFHSIETRMKMSESAKKFRKENPDFATGKNHPFFGKNHSEETKELNRKSHEGRVHSKETRKKMSEAHSKEKHHNWIDGRSYLPYTPEFTLQLKEEIRNRDNYICQGCGMTQEEHLIVHGQVLHVHHIDYIKLNCDKNNLISTCLHCNVRANHNRGYWQEFYTNKIGVLNVGN